MEFTKGVLDYGDAPQIHVDGVHRTALISPGIVRVSLYSPYPRGSGHELRTVLHLLWDRQRFLSVAPIYDRARAAVALADGFRIVSNH